MQIWKLRVGDTRHNRNYADLCIANGVALLGMDEFSMFQEKLRRSADEESALDEYLDSLCAPEMNRDGSSYFRSSARFVRRFRNVRRDDVIILVHGSAVFAVGKVTDDVGDSIAECGELGLLDIDGWQLPLARAVSWKLPVDETGTHSPVPCDIPATESGKVFSRFGIDRFGGAPGRGDIVVEILGGDSRWQPTTTVRGFGTARSWKSTKREIRALPAACVIDRGQLAAVLDAVTFYRSCGDRVREHEVVTHAVVPFLIAIGWKAPEQIEIEGEFVDVRLYVDRDQPPAHAYIEAKRFWSSTTGSRLQVRAYADSHPLLPRDSPIATTTGGRWAVWRRGDGDELYLDAYCDLSSPEQPARHPLLEHLAEPGKFVGGFERVVAIMSPPT